VGKELNQNDYEPLNLENGSSVSRDNFYATKLSFFLSYFKSKTITYKLIITSFLLEHLVSNSNDIFLVDGVVEKNEFCSGMFSKSP